VNGTLSDGSGSANYPSNASCEWMIASSNASLITLHFTQFSMQLYKDVVKVFECMDALCLQQQQLAELSGTYSALPVVTSTTSFVKVVFTSDDASEFDGFKATWSMVSPCFQVAVLYHLI
jgi:hypothetical protein